jgi:hypothetical protein
MQNIITWAGRIGLVVVLAFCVQGALDPHYNARKWAPPPDAMMHIIYGYLLTVLSILALPKVKPLAIGGVFIALGVGLEVGQALGLISGSFQYKDLVANLGGVIAALLPLSLAKRKAR